MLLSSLVALFVLAPIVKRFPAMVPLLDLAFTSALLSALWTAAVERREFRIGLLLAIPTVGSRWLIYGADGEVVELARIGLPLLFFVYTTGRLLAAVVRERSVTRDTISGGISVYLLLGFCWALAYAFVERAAPGSLTGEAFDPTAFGSFLYFSFVTLTTLGYGEITPASLTARMMCAGEAITGPLYLAILVARLVAMELTSRER
jgi:hypothetical protein